ncbi:MAG: helix-turn-helix domain-containing protein [Oscillospiraceae bacterium]|nr:helix-turn-helix domain-containing protein [Oscillospiraceae bacterium]
MFTEKLSDLMKKNNIKNSKELSSLSNIPYTTIRSLYENGTGGIRATTLMKLATFFDCSINYLLDDNIPVGQLIHFKIQAEYNVEGETSSELNTSSSENTPIPIKILGKVSAGTPIYVTENLDGYAYAPSSLIKKGYDYFYLKVGREFHEFKI